MQPHPATDPDIDLHIPAERRELGDRPWVLLSVIAAGGVIGAETRYGLQTAFPHPPDGFDWATFGINVSGCLLIGVLMVFVNRVFVGRKLVRPFIGVGILGGYTTFSTYAVGIQKAVNAGAARTGLLYLGITLIGALVAVWLGHSVTDAVVRRRQPVDAAEKVAVGD